jgi:ribosome recycling factor
MSHPLQNEAKEKMHKSLDSFKLESSHIRTGRDSTGLLESTEVEVYGAKMKINQVADITAPEPHLLLIAPWDKGQMPVIEKAIMASPLDITPSNDGNLIRLPFPALTEQRREEPVKLVSKMAEETRLAIHNVRCTIVDAIKNNQKDGKIPEDDAHNLTADVQKLTDDFCAKVDDAFKAKDAEIMEV